MPQIISSEAADADLDSIDEYLASIDPELAHDTIARIIAAVARLRDFPEIGSPLDGDRRSLAVPRSPYRIVYRYRAVVEILRIRHEREDWRG